MKRVNLLSNKFKFLVCLGFISFSIFIDAVFLSPNLRPYIWIPILAEAIIAICILCYFFKGKDKCEVNESGFRIGDRAFAFDQILEIIFDFPSILITGDFTIRTKQPRRISLRIRKYSHINEFIRGITFNLTGSYDVLKLEERKHQSNEFLKNNYMEFRRNPMFQFEIVFFTAFILLFVFATVLHGNFDKSMLFIVAYFVSLITYFLIVQSYFLIDDNYLYVKHFFFKMRDREIPLEDIIFVDIYHLYREIYIYIVDRNLDIKMINCNGLRLKDIEKLKTTICNNYHKIDRVVLRPKSE